jgi:hypothetical protein
LLANRVPRQSATAFHGARPRSGAVLACAVPWRSPEERSRSRLCRSTALARGAEPFSSALFHGARPERGSALPTALRRTPRSRNCAEFPHETAPPSTPKARVVNIQRITPTHPDCSLVFVGGSRLRLRARACRGRSCDVLVPLPRNSRRLRSWLLAQVCRSEARRMI